MTVSAPYPNPVSVGPVKVNLHSDCAKRVRWSVFSAAYRKIAENVIDVQGKTTVFWYLTDVKGKRVAAGLYYMVFVPEGQKSQVRTVIVQP
jgi:hypothetical protein